MKSKIFQTYDRTENFERVYNRGKSKVLNNLRYQGEEHIQSCRRDAQLNFRIEEGAQVDRVRV